MKVPKPRKLSSGNWFIQLRLGGESVSVTELTEKQCIKTAQLVKAEYLAGKRGNAARDNITLEQAIDKYVGSRSNILSPSTLRGYNTIKRNRFTDVMNKPISGIKDWQVICNEEAKTCSAKTLQNSWRFIASVLRYSNFPAPHINLPQVVAKERPYLEPEQIPLFMKALRGQSCEIPALLALHSLRRSEICALDWGNVDLKNKRILVSGAMVPDEKHKLIQKDTNKNRASKRYIPIMINELQIALEAVADKSGSVVKLSPDTVRKQIDKVCKTNSLPLVGVHGLRHSFASLAYHLEVPQKVVMQIGGWADPGTMNKIYTHLSQKDITKHENELTKFFKNANGKANARNK